MTCTKTLQVCIDFASSRRCWTVKDTNNCNMLSYLLVNLPWFSEVGQAFGMCIQFGENDEQRWYLQLRRNIQHLRLRGADSVSEDAFRINDS